MMFFCGIGIILLTLFSLNTQFPLHQPWVKVGQLLAGILIAYLGYKKLPKPKDDK